MKTKLHYSIVCALLIALSACSSKLNTSPSSSVNAGKTLLDVMKEKIEGFNVGMWPSSNPPASGLTGAGGWGGTAATPFAKKMSYKIFDKEVHLVMDGVDVERFYVPDIRGQLTGDYVSDRNKALIKDRMQFIEAFLTGIRAEDVIGIEVMSPKDNERYKSEFAYKIGASLSTISTDFAYVKVTTRSGNGAFMK